MKKLLYMAIATMAFVFLPSQSAFASFIGFESLPTSNSIHVSRHGTGGPVLADDFTSSRRGLVVGIEWWGAASLTGGADQWEATFHFDAGGVPAATAPSGGITQHLFSASGSDLDGDGIFHYTAAWNPADIFILANTTYWFSVANASGAGWTWANGGVPGIGLDFFDAAVSTGIGPNGGPHFGPWGTLAGTDFAFRIILAPEPGSLALVGLGLVGVVLVLRRHTV